MITGFPLFVCLFVCLSRALITFQTTVIFHFPSILNQFSSQYTLSNYLLALCTFPLYVDESQKEGITGSLGDSGFLRVGMGSDEGERKNII